MEKIVVELDKNLWDRLLDTHVFCLGKKSGLLKANEDYIIKEVKIEDDFFKEDATHKELRSQANKAYKKLKEYEYTKRNK